MNKEKLKLLLLTIGAVAYDALFYENTPGINIMILTILLSAIVLLIEKKSFLNKKTLILYGLTLLCSVNFVYSYSLISFFSWLISLIIFAGFYHANWLNNLFFASVYGIVNFMFAPFIFLKSLRDVILNTTKNFIPTNRIVRISKIYILPLLISFIFLFLFKSANPVIAKWYNLIADAILNKVFESLNSFSFFHIFFMIFSIIMMSFWIYKWSNNNKDLDDDFDTELKRKRLNPYDNFKFTPVSLKNELKSSVIMLLILNILTSIENIIDFMNIWFGFSSRDINLSDFVHHGTYILITCIILASGILLVIFRKNQNFYTKNRFLKKLAYLLIAQNIFMTVSVVIRNFHYINTYGLTFKRIGVFFFILLTLVGMILLFNKIYKRKTIWYLFSEYCKYSYIVLIAASLFPWENIVINHNINNTSHIHLDKEYLLTFSNKSLPLLHKHKYLFYDTPNLENRLNNRIEWYISRLNLKSWESWNYNEHKTIQYFKNSPDFKKYFYENCE